MNGQPKVLPPCGFMAAAWAATDTAAGVWKAPAGLDVPVGGITGLQANLSDDDSGALNPQGINAIRQFSIGGNVVWGARTVYGSDTLNDEYKYLPVRRLLLYIETSLRFGTMWAVFQPNGPSLWSRLQTQISTFMAGLFSQGALAGTSASQAFFVKCDATTTLPSDQAAGIVNVQVGFAPLYPAEFVVITVSQQTAKSS
jgi:phage tail sheath protein FI